MAKKRTVLLIDFLMQKNRFGNYVSLSTASLKAYAEKFEHIRNHYHIALFPVALERVRARAILSLVAETKPRVIGLSCYLWNVEAYRALLPALRAKAPHALIVAGGPEAHPGLLHAMPDLDLLVLGEGEATFLEILETLIQGRAPDRVPGTVFRENGVARAGAPRPPIPCLDDIPSPYLSGILKPMPVKHIEYNRGCQYKCTFCTDANTGYRHFSLERIEAEIRHCIEHNVMLGLFCGSYLNHGDFGTSVLKLILKYRAMGHNISIADTLFINANNDDEEFFDLLDEAVPDKQALNVAVGIQCSDQATLKLCKRILRRKSIKRLLTTWDFQYMGQVIVGLPGDDIFKVAGTLAFTVTNNPYCIQTFPLYILPNTYLFENRGKFNIESNEAAPHELYSIGNQSRRQVKTMRLMAESFAMEYNAFCR